MIFFLGICFNRLTRLQVRGTKAFDRKRRRKKRLMLSHYSKGENRLHRSQRSRITRKIDNVFAQMTSKRSQLLSLSIY